MAIIKGFKIRSEIDQKTKKASILFIEKNEPIFSFETDTELEAVIKCFIKLPPLIEVGDF